MAADRTRRVLALLFGAASLVFMGLTVWLLAADEPGASLASLVIGILLLSSSISLAVKTGD